MTARATRTFSLDRDILAEVKRSKGNVSESERVNRLLRLALEQERKAALETEIAGFFDRAPSNRAERRAFQSAGVAVWTRE